jgi:hypothetical protein
MDLADLRAETIALLTLIDIAMTKAKQEAKLLECDPFDLRTDDGKRIMNELIEAKVKAHHSLVLLELIERGGY